MSEKCAACGFKFQTSETVDHGNGIKTCNRAVCLRQISGKETGECDNCGHTGILKDGHCNKCRTDEKFADHLQSMPGAEYTA